MEKRHMVPFDSRLAFHAADISLKHGLALADSLVYATALSQHARLVTSDNDFRGLPGVVLV